MAKAIKNENVVAITERFAFILFAVTRNFCRDSTVGTDANLKELTGLLVKGYDATKGVCSVERAENVPDWEKLLEMDMEARRNQWENLKGSKNTDPIPLEVFEEMFVLNGKLLEPKYSANMCFQRGSIFFNAMVERRRLARNPKEADEQARSGNDGSLRDMWPIAVKTYTDEGERISDQLNENTGKNRGATPLSDLAQLRVGLKYWDMCFPQTRFRKEFTSDSMGQRIYYICELNARFQGLRIAERMRMDAASEQYLPFSGCKHTDLTDLAHATDPDYGQTVFETKHIAKNQFLQVRDGFPQGVKHPAKMDVVSDYFERLKSGPLQKPIMKRSDMLDVIKQSGNPVIQDTVRAVLGNNMDFFQAHLTAKHEHSLLCEIQQLGGLGEANRLLTDLLSDLQAKYQESRSEGTNGQHHMVEAITV